MGVASTTVEMNAPAAKAWDAIADFGGILKWAPVDDTATIECEGEGVGMVRVLYFPGIGTAREVLDVLDHNTMTLVLTITEGLPFGASEYRATISVEALGDDRCACTWRGDFTVPEGVSEDEVKASFEGAYVGMFGGLAGYIGG